MVKLINCLMVFKHSGYRMGIRVNRSIIAAKGSEYLFEGNEYAKLSQSPESGVTKVNNKLRIRLAQAGTTNRRFYKIVAAHKSQHRDYEIEQLGTFDPYPNSNKEKICSLNFERIKYYIALGALPVKPVRRLLGLSGFLPLDPTLVLYAKGLRRRREIEKLIEEKESAQNEDEVD